MATLTADEIEYIRAMSGDDCTPPEVSDALMQKLHDRGLTMTCGCTAAEDVTVVLVLQVRVAKSAKLFDETPPEGGSATVSQKHQHLKDLLSRWEEKCGLSGGTITVSPFDLGLDTESDSEYTPYGSYPSWWSVWGL
jgi:hypothetical protein